MEVTEEEYQAAVAQKDKAEKVIEKYHDNKRKLYSQRWEEFRSGVGAPYKPEEIRYSAHARCEHTDCGAGLAYPLMAPPSGRWDCARYLLGNGPEHTSYPFAFYSIKSETQPSADGATTRPKA